MDEITSKISEAISITKDLEEPYKSISFKVILDKLLSGESQSRESQITSVVKRDLIGPATAARMQASEFLASLELRSQLDQLEAIAYYYLHSGQESVTRAEILDTLGKARLPRPRNISDVISKCIRRGHIIEAVAVKDGQKALQITPTGERYIEEKLKPSS